MTGRTLRLTGKRTVVVAFAFVFTSLSFLWAAVPPANDTCGGAVAVPGAGPFPWLSPLIADINAASTNGDPVPLPTICITSSGLSRSIWYQFTPSAAALYTFSVNVDTATTVEDTAMGIYASAGGCGGPFQLLECNDDALGGQESLRSAISMNLGTGTNYYIVLWAAFAPPAGLETNKTAVQLRVSKPGIPTNDVCSGAEVIPGSGPFPYFTSTNDIIRATTTNDPPAPLCTTGDLFHSVWFRFTPTVSGPYAISSGASTATTVYDTLLALYAGTPACSGYRQVTCTNAALGETITTNLVATTNYYIVVWNTETAIPGETLLQLRVGRVLPPTVIRIPADAITTNSAVLHAVINPNDALTRAWFQWGTTTNYGNVTPTRTMGSGGSDIATNALITGLSPGTLYHFRAVATNYLGMTLGGDLAFTTAVEVRITSIVRLFDGNYHLRFIGKSGEVYKVEGSTSLISWSELGTATDLGGGSFEFVDLNAASFQQRFYRIKGP